MAVESVEFDDLFSRSDIVSLHCPLLESTYQLIGERELKLMGQEAILINTSRGPVVDEAALIRALQNGHTPEVAKCLATAYEAGENAIEAGVIQETVTKQNERAAKIVLPRGTDWEMRLRRAVGDVKSAAGLLDRANIADLKRAATRKLIAAAHAKFGVFGQAK